MLKLSQTCKVLSQAIRARAWAQGNIDDKVKALTARRARLALTMQALTKEIEALTALTDTVDADVNTLCLLAMSEAEQAISGDSDYDYCGQETIAERCRAMAIDALRDIGAYACAASLNRNTTVVR